VKTRSSADAKSEDIIAEFDALDELLDTTPVTVAVVAAVPEVVGTDPYGEGSYSAAAWAYNRAGYECAVDRLMLAMAATLRRQTCA
jgi:hypothetical protein